MSLENQNFPIDLEFYDDDGTFDVETTENVIELEIEGMSSIPEHGHDDRYYTKALTDARIAADIVAHNVSSVAHADIRSLATIPTITITEDQLEMNEKEDPFLDSYVYTPTSAQIAIITSANTSRFILDVQGALGYPYKVMCLRETELDQIKYHAFWMDGRNVMAITIGAWEDENYYLEYQTVQTVPPLPIGEGGEYVLKANVPETGYEGTYDWELSEGDATWGHVGGNINNQTDLQTQFGTKVDKVAGKGLSTNDYDNTEKGKVADNTSARHSHANKALLDTYTQTEANLSDAVLKRHLHANMALLETYNQTNANLSDAVSKKHEHANKALLDSYNQTNANIADAISKKHSHANFDILNRLTSGVIDNSHTHNNKALLDTYAQTEENLADAVAKKHAHANKALLDSYTQTDSAICDAINKKHTHSNKGVLDNLTQSVIDNAHTHANKALLDTYEQTEDNLADAVSKKHTHANKSVIDGIAQSDIDNWNSKAAGDHDHDGRYYTETETDTLLAGKQNVIDSSHKLSADLVADGSTNKVVTQAEKNAWNGKQPAGSYMTLDTNQTATSKKTLSYTEPIVRGGQETILNVLSTHTNDEMEAMWAGRVKIGNMNKTFMLGVYRQLLLGQPAICGIGAHSWSNSFTEEGAAWEDIYLNPDGDKAVYIGDHDWRAGTGWFKVQNNGTDYDGKTYCNRGSITSPTWREVATVNDGSLYATNETWSASKLNTQFSGKEATANKVTSISSASTNTQYPSAKCVYDAIFGAMEASY